MADSADITSLLASRICHDLVSPVGAIVNGIDLIRDTGVGDASEEVAMISQSAARASVLLQFYRIAFGAADDDVALSRSSVETQAAQMLATPKFVLDWEGLDGPPLSRSEGRLLFQMLLCARAIAGLRGRIAIRLDLAESFPMSIAVLPLGGHPGTPGVNHEALQLLASEFAGAEISARQIEFAMVHDTARRLGVTLSVSTYGEGARVEAARR